MFEHASHSDDAATSAYVLLGARPLFVLCAPLIAAHAVLDLLGEDLSEDFPRRSNRTFPTLIPNALRQ